ncbi:MAG: zinc ribbon domain-containing protein [Firmicutes bacterium]|nr:zinc ribbon domain-containing protein [Bacillota bacterium]
MYCSKCGKEVKADDNFCPACGQKIEQEYKFETRQDEWLTGTKIGEKISNANSSPIYENATIILGVFSIFCFLMNVLGIMFVHLLGIGLAIAALILIKKDKQNSGEFSTVGNILSIIGLTLCGFALVYGMFIGILMNT